MLTRVPPTLTSQNTMSSSHWLVSKARSQFPQEFVRQLQSRPQLTSGEYQQRPASAASAGVAIKLGNIYL